MYTHEMIRPSIGSRPSDVTIRVAPFHLTSGAFYCISCVITTLLCVGIFDNQRQISVFIMGLTNISGTTPTLLDTKKTLDGATSVSDQDDLQWDS